MYYFGQPVEYKTSTSYCYIAAIHQSCEKSRSGLWLTLKKVFPNGKYQIIMVRPSNVRKKSL